MSARGAALSLLCLTQVACLDAPPDSNQPATPPRSLEFFGNPYQQNGIDRVWIPAERPGPVGRLGHDNFTIELWLKVGATALEADGCPASWWEGTIFFDREFLVSPQNGSVGLSLYGTATGAAIAAGFTVIDTPGVDLCGDAEVGDGQWHHVALTRNLDSEISLWVDGALDETVEGPPGDGSVTQDPVDPDPADLFLVLGGPKQASGRPGFTGLIDDLRLSDDDLYDEPFAPPYPPLSIDPEDTLALWRFDEGEGLSSEELADDDEPDADAALRVGGEPAGPVWSEDVPPAQP